VIARGLTLVAALAGVVYRAPPPTVRAPGSPVADQEWNEAVQAARTDRQKADPEGRYFGSFVKRLAEIQSPALRACKGQYPSSATVNFQAVACLSKDGKIQRLLMRPVSDFHGCVRGKIMSATLPRPPKAPYWIFWGSLEGSPGSR